VRSGQVVGGVSYLYKEKSKFSLEAFYKSYDNYPFLTRDSISLANLGGDFGVVGNEPAVPTGEGRAYGLEFLYQQKLAGGFYGLLSYTFVRSEFTDKNGDFVPSSWDNRHLVSLVGGKKFKNDWEIGVRWRLLGGAPFTPFDEETTALIPVWDVTGRGIPDIDRLNSERLGVYHQLDLRVDKKWFFEKWNLNLYFDIQNAYGFELQAPPFLDVVRDDQGDPVVDPNDPNRYQLRTLENSVGTVLPSIGVIIDF
jgi:outer membrane receptor protein involved in Fe transport